jgi:hypothetical protein
VRAGGPLAKRLGQNVRWGLNFLAAHALGSEREGRKYSSRVTFVPPGCHKERGGVHTFPERPRFKVPYS